MPSSLSSSTLSPAGVTSKPRRSPPQPLPQAQHHSYQDLLPTELWRHIIDLVPTLDLFHLYNTSTFMRAVTAPRLVQEMASKTVRLYLYQEYVRRVGIKFEFDHFDLKRDRVVFRPQVQEHQHRFKCGLTLQSPQLEEVAVKSRPGVVFAPHQIHSVNGRYFTIRTAGRPAAGSSTLSGVSESTARTTAATIESTDAANEVNMFEAPESESQLSERAVGEKGYQGTRNFLDKTCPVYIRKQGVRKLEGARYSFLRDYPWTLHYRVRSEPFGAPEESNIKGVGKKDGGDNGNRLRKRERFFFDIREQLRAQSPQHIEAEREHEEAGHPGGNADGSDSGVISSGEDNVSRVASFESSASGPSSSGPRFMRALLFECSMNFLDPTRATRSLIGRWLEGKVHRWKRALGGKKGATPQEPGGVEQASRGRIIHAIDNILGGPPGSRAS